MKCTEQDCYISTISHAVVPDLKQHCSRIPFFTISVPLQLQSALSWRERKNNKTVSSKLLLTHPAARRPAWCCVSLLFAGLLLTSSVCFVCYKHKPVSFYVCFLLSQYISCLNATLGSRFWKLTCIKIRSQACYTASVYHVFCFSFNRISII